ncbi:hypothetical protein FS837_007720 [Tulasnella sp. UAMH 9824]|nr:hypothetical protein FS837_007720 [Tulasnella sp. UAMH 9824]
MSTRPRPRPRPRSKASKESAIQVPSSEEVSTSFAIAPGKVDDVVKEVVKEEAKKPEPVNPALAYFMMNKKNDARQKQRASAITKLQREQAKVAHVEYDLDQDIPEPESPVGKRKMKDSVLPTAPKTQLPSWARDVRNISPVASDADSEIEIIEVREASDDEDLSPRSKRARLTSSSEPSQGLAHKRKDKQKARKRSSSPEIEVPPTLTAADRAEAQAAFRAHFPRPGPRASSPDLLADRSTDSIAELNPELQELAKRVRKNITRATSEAASGKPEVVVIRVVYHPHPQNPPGTNPPKSWAFKMKRTDELKPVFERVAAETFVPIDRIKICHNGIDVFKLATPDSIQSIWAEADFDAYLDTTLRYMRENRIASPSKASHPSRPTGGLNSSAAGPSSKANNSADDEDDVAEQLADDAIKLYLQGSSSSKKVPWAR